MATFTYLPDYGASKKIRPQVQSVKFGDGYEARNAFGLNTNPQEWDLKFSSRNTTDTDAIDAFLLDKGGVTAFAWTPPGGSSLNFICREWSRSVDHAGIYTISATFTQVFEP